MTENPFEQKRKQLVELLRGETFPHSILDAFSRVKRECFIPEKYGEYAYANDAIPIGFNQTISQPSTIAQMLQLLELHPEQKILEVGSGSGYVLALLSEITGKKGSVFGIEFEKELWEQSKKNLECNATKKTKTKCADGSDGWAECAPFDRILISAAAPLVPKPLFGQLAENGIIVAPLGDPGFQTLTILKKIRGKPLKKEFTETFFTFVPLRGKYIQKIREKIEA